MSSKISSGHRATVSFSRGVYTSLFVQTNFLLRFKATPNNLLLISSCCGSEIEFEARWRGVERSVELACHTCRNALDHYRPIRTIHTTRTSLLPEQWVLSLLDDPLEAVVIHQALQNAVAPCIEVLKELNEADSISRFQRGLEDPSYRDKTLMRVLDEIESDFIQVDRKVRTLK